MVCVGAMQHEGGQQGRSWELGQAMVQACDKSGASWPGGSDGL